MTQQPFLWDYQTLAHREIALQGTRPLMTLEQSETSDHVSLGEYITSSNIVKVYVGPERQLLYIREQLLSNCVPYFRTALENNPQPGREKELELPEEDPAAFKYVVEWASPEVDSGRTKPYNEEHDPEYVIELFETYVLCM